MSFCAILSFKFMWVFVVVVVSLFCFWIKISFFLLNMLSQQTRRKHSVKIIHWTPWKLCIAFLSTVSFKAKFMEFVQASVRLNCSAIGLEILWESEYLEAQVGLSDYQKKKNNRSSLDFQISMHPWKQLVSKTVSIWHNRADRWLNSKLVKYV